MFVLFLFTGCELQKEVGQPFHAVELHQASKNKKPVAKEKPKKKKRVTLTSDDFATEEADSPPRENKKSSVPEAQASKPVSSAEVPTAPLPVLSQYPVNNVPTLPPSPYAFSLQNWPIVVIDTAYDLNPPRALIALPSGEEVSVQAGQMLPQYNLVVMSIGKNAVDFVRISQIGSQTKVEPLQIIAQN